MTSSNTSAQIMGLDTTLLAEGENGHFLQAQVLHAFKQMQTAAGKDGVDIQICSSFRNFERQLAIWNKKWRGHLPLFTLTGKELNHDALNEEEKIHAIMLWSALPGASRHHWGTDFDVYDKAAVESMQHDFQLVPSEYENGGPCANLSAWLQQHAQEYGFGLPYAKYVGGVAKEPWHLSFLQLASSIEQQFNISALRAQLEKADIDGKQSILALLPSLVSRYTFNKGCKK